MTWDADKFVSLDLETHLIEAGLLTPRIVCGSTADASGARLLLRDEDDGDEVLDLADSLLSGDRIIVGANIAYDMGCLVAEWPYLLPLIFKAYAEGRVYDVQIAQALHAIAEGNLYADPITGIAVKGRYSLDRCVKYVLGRADAKANDYWRLRYAFLDGVPISDWPEEAKQYPIDDARNTLEVARAQVLGGGAGPTPGPHRNLDDLSNQVESAWALHLGAIWGLRTDGAKVAELRAKAEREHGVFFERLRELGFVRPDGKEDRAEIKRAVIRAYGGGRPCPAGCVGGRVISEKTGKAKNCGECSGTGLDPTAAPKTETGGVCANRDALVESGDDDLAALGDNEHEKTLSTYLPFLESGIARPISLRPNVLVASGRTSYDNPIQQMPRLGGERPCFAARPGYVFASVDYAALELCTLAQVCLILFGYSEMAETINASGDPGALHTAFAASLAGKTSEEMTALVKAGDENAAKYRQAAKAANFGFPGGMGAAKFVVSKRKKSEGTTTAPDGFVYQGIRFCVLLRGAERCGIERVTEWNGRPTPPICRVCAEAAEDLRREWFQQWPTIKRYFAWVTERVGDEGRGELPCFGTARVRGGLDFTNGANNGFQALAADGAKNALRKVVREAYGFGPTGRESPLFGARPIFFVHDEIFSEFIEERASAAAKRKCELMIEGMREYVPDVCIRVEPSLSRFWFKDAKPVYRDGDRDGELLVWEPKQVKEAA